MENLTNYYLQYLFIGALIPLIVICVLLIIAKLSYQLNKKNHKIRFIETLFRASGELLDEKSSEINQLESDLMAECSIRQTSAGELTETKKKLIDAMQQKTRANDYAKECEEKMKAYVLQDKLQNETIKQFEAINKDQSKSIKHMIIVYGHACDELKAKEALLVKCEERLKAFNDLGYSIIYTTNTSTNETFPSIAKYGKDGNIHIVKDSTCDTTKECDMERVTLKSEGLLPNIGNPAKVKPYYYEYMFYCKKKYVKTEGSYCRDICENTCAFGSNSKGHYIKCQTLNDSLDKFNGIGTTY